MLVYAETQLAAPPPISGAGVLEVPDGARRLCETTIERVSNTIAVLNQAKSGISSPMPPVAFVLESEAEVAHLADARGVRCGPRAVVHPRFPVPMSPTLLAGLTDRADGLALFAEMASQSSGLGRYRECVRLLELAFALPVAKLPKKLTQFLATGEGGYTRPEIDAWLVHRDAAIHGDQGRTAGLVVEGDVRIFISRMELAVFDLLLNKMVWHSPSRERRPLVTLPALTTSPSGGLRILQGATGNLEARLLDVFGSYPQDLSANLNALPEHWWLKQLPDEPRGPESGVVDA